MKIILEHVLNAGEIDEIRSIVARENFIDGQISSSLLGKNNLQIPAESQGAEVAGRILIKKLTNNEIFQHAVQPLFIQPPLISRYEVGMEYPQHVDNAVMNGRRTDMALTLFLSDLDTYEGGDLVIATSSGECRYRLPPGHVIVYPASTLHRVAKVTRGTRLAMVSWVQSTIRDHAKRSILYQLGKTTFNMVENPYSARLRRSYANLLRLWAEV